MGRIKNSLIKRTAKLLLKEENNFKDTFNPNKKLLGSSMPSKRLRNQIAGYITRLAKNEQKKQLRMQQPDYAENREAQNTVNSKY